MCEQIYKFNKLLMQVRFTQFLGGEFCVYLSLCNLPNDKLKYMPEAYLYRAIHVSFLYLLSIRSVTKLMTQCVEGTQTAQFEGLTAESSHQLK